MLGSEATQRNRCPEANLRETHLLRNLCICPSLYVILPSNLFIELRRFVKLIQGLFPVVVVLVLMKHIRSPVLWMTICVNKWFFCSSSGRKKKNSNASFSLSCCWAAAQKASFAKSDRQFSFPSFTFTFPSWPTLYSSPRSVFLLRRQI